MADAATPMAQAPVQAPAEYGDVFAAARGQYPILAKDNITYAFQPQGVERTGKLEFYPPGETDRPADFPIDKPGVAVFDKDVRPIDILADYVSHYGREKDPVIQKHYDQFVQSMTPAQKAQLTNQYQYALQNEGEKRPFEEWVKISGIPAYYRGYLFDQWDKPEKRYTPAQLKSFDEMKKYLGITQDEAP